MADEAVISILLLGDSGVGSPLSSPNHANSRLTRGRDAAPNIPLPILQDLDQPYIFDIHARSGSYRFEFFDTASPDNYTLLRPHVIILCYSIADRTTLQSVHKHWKYMVETHFNYDGSMPVMLLGLQRDLRREGDEMVVFPQTGVMLAQEMRCDRYAECSAVTGELCKEVFEDVARMAVGTRFEGGGRSEGWNACSVM